MSPDAFERVIDAFIEAHRAGSAGEPLRRTAERFAGMLPRYEIQLVFARDRERPPATPSEFILSFGKYKGRSVADVVAIDHSYAAWLVENIKGKSLVRALRLALESAEVGSPR
jgi:hypothetical protein